MRLLSGVQNAETSALQGIQRATAQLDDAAGRVARAGAVPGGTDSVNVSSEGRALAEPPPAADSLAGAIVDQHVARNLLAANVKTLQVSDDMNRELMQIGARRR